MATVIIEVKLESNRIVVDPSTKIMSGDNVIWRVKKAKGYDLTISIPSPPVNVNEKMSSDSHDCTRTVGVARSKGTTLDAPYTLALKGPAAPFTDPPVETSTLVIERGVEPIGNECGYGAKAPCPGDAGAPDRSRGEQRLGQ